MNEKFCNISNIEEAVNSLIIFFQNGELNNFFSEKEDDLIFYHHTLGRWIRNNLGLWEDSKLFQYFINSGIEHQDEMSYQIMSSLWKKYNSGNKL